MVHQTPPRGSYSVEGQDIKKTTWKPKIVIQFPTFTRTISILESN